MCYILSTTSHMWGGDILPCKLHWAQQGGHGGVAAPWEKKIGLYFSVGGPNNGFLHGFAHGFGA